MQLIDVLNMEEMEVLFEQWGVAGGINVALVDTDGKILIGEGTLSEYCENVVAKKEVLGAVYAILPEDGVIDGEAAERNASAMAAVVNKMIGTVLNWRKEEERDTAIHEKVEETLTYIRKMNDITKNLDKLEKNQKILSLNASIEAARAGEAGRGFAIVATNVASLASDFGTQNHEIKEAVQKLNALMESIEQA
ncbi:MAG: methyl-accepting chemotaxis protein [Roseburia sp.]